VSALRPARRNVNHESRHGRCREPRSWRCAGRRAPSTGESSSRRRAPLPAEGLEAQVGIVFDAQVLIVRRATGQDPGSPPCETLWLQYPAAIHCSTGKSSGSGNSGVIGIAHRTTCAYRLDVRLGGPHVCATRVAPPALTLLTRRVPAGQCAPALPKVVVS
jgi:hypothetical protein